MDYNDIHSPFPTSCLGCKFYNSLTGKVPYLSLYRFIQSLPCLCVATMLATLKDLLAREVVQAVGPEEAAIGLTG